VFEGGSSCAALEVQSSLILSVTLQPFHFIILQVYAVEDTIKNTEKRAVSTLLFFRLCSWCRARVVVYLITTPLHSCKTW
jgi:hypothetical protein